MNMSCVYPLLSNLFPVLGGRWIYTLNKSNILFQTNYITYFQLMNFKLYQTRKILLKPVGLIILKLLY